MTTMPLLVHCMDQFCDKFCAHVAWLGTSIIVTQPKQYVFHGRYCVLFRIHWHFLCLQRGLFEPWLWFQRYSSKVAIIG
jgi:hypothetical protein